MRFALLSVFGLAALVSGSAVVAEDAVALYGPPVTEVLETENRRIDTREKAVFAAHILPWTEGVDTTLEQQAQRAFGPSGAVPALGLTPESVPKLIQVAPDFAMSLPVRMKTEAGEDASAVLFACDYKGEKTLYREIVFIGDIFSFMAVGKTKVIDRLLKRAKDLCAEDPKEAKRAAVRQLVTTAPGEGDGARRLKHMVFSLKQGLNAYGTFQVTYKTYALFDDGQAVRSLGIPLPDFDVEASRKYQPEIWAAWRETAPGRFEIGSRNDAGDVTWRKISGSYRIVSPLPEGERMLGRFEFWKSYGPLFNGGTTKNGVFVFREDGTYASSSSSMFSSANIMGSTVNRVRTEGPDGCESASSVIGGVAVVQSKSDPSCGDGKAGTYEMTPWVLTLHANNGVRARFPFFPTGKASFYLNGHDWGKTTK